MLLLDNLTASASNGGGTVNRCGMKNLPPLSSPCVRVKRSAHRAAARAPAIEQWLDKVISADAMQKRLNQ
jgi:hypothetical protein